jgi:hypothetical protein
LLTFFSGEKIMGIPPVGELYFDGILCEADYIGVKYIENVRCECFQPSTADCTTVRCDPLDGSKPFFINAEDF